ncbi:protocadherin-15-like isoform X5 [Asterias rubens]|uniref:protocadherin-15-like isoform X5 n=1 Tax=Asterias rubens TaxID=7604 RepID=UPI0014557D36|nr:protocadherin-15-like isoform X5 [Asterias rubens]
MMMAYKSRIDRLQCLLCVVVAIILLNISQHQCEGSSHERARYRRQTEITVCTRNDNDPSNIVSFSVREDALPGDLIGFLPIIGNPMDPNATIHLSVIDSAQSNIVLLNTSEKSLLLAQRVNPDLPDRQISLQLQVKCDLLRLGLSFSYDINVEIININDNSPEFVNLPYIANISELTATDTVIYSGIQAVDLDGSNSNGQVIYSVEFNPQDPEASNYFTIKNGGRGEVWLQRSLDYEAKRIWEVLIVAKDNGDEQQQSNTTVLTVNVLDGDDMPPQFLPCNFTIGEPCPPITYSATILEKQTLSGAITFEPGPIRAVDPDTDVTMNQPITYSISTGYPPEYGEYFNINAATGDMFLLQPVYRADFKEFTLEVMASESLSMESNFYVITSATITIQEVNEHRPVFTQDIYQGFVYENAQIGTQVSMNEFTTEPLKLHALDLDVEQGRPLMLSYFLSDATAHFLLEAGPDGSFAYIVINSNQLDREMVNNYTLRALAIENSTFDMLESESATINIKVLDVNDNPPQFVINEYSQGFNHFRGTVEENAEVGTVIMSLSTEDVDLPPRGPVIFDLEYYNPGSNTLFGQIRVNDTSVNFVLLQSGGIVEGQQYSFYMKATDGNLDTLVSERIYIEVIVLPANISHPPVFINSIYSASASENLPSGASVITVTALDEDGDTLIYRITGGNVNGAFTVDPLSGNVMVIGILDREVLARYELTIEATDGLMVGNCILMINILDVNDNNPVFINQQTEFLVVEGVAGKMVGKVEATDMDEPNTPNSRVRYSLVSDAFSIDSFNGGIITVVALDRETQDRYELDIVASDEAASPRTTTLRITVIVQDVNDNGPMFVPVEYTVDVIENDIVKGFLVLRALDIDETAVLEYTIISGDVQTFSIDPNNGSLSLLKVLDFETIQTHMLQVTVHDTGSIELLNATATVTVNVLDVNDHAPVFTMNSYQGAVLRSADLETVAASGIRATDGDLSSTPNGQVHYAFSPASVYFYIPDKTEGVFVTKTSLQNAPEIHNLTVIAYDDGNPSSSAMASLIILVRMEKPVFPQSVYTVNDLKEEEPVGTKVIELQASANQGDEIEYQIIAGDEDDKFELVSLNNMGTVTTKAVLDRENVSTYSLMVQASVIEATTGGGNGRRRRQATDPSVVEIYIELVDINDNQPTFPESAYFTGVSESASVGTAVITMTAIDLDSNNNSLISYSMSMMETSAAAANDASKPTPDSFSMGESTGIIRTLAEFAAEPRIFKYTVTGRERFGPPDKNANTTITISLINEDNRAIIAGNVPPTLLRNDQDLVEAALEDILDAEVVIEDVGVRNYGTSLEKSDPSGSDAQFYVIDRSTGEPLTNDRIIELLKDLTKLDEVYKDISTDGNGRVIEVRKPTTGRQAINTDAEPAVEAVALLCLAVALFICCILAIAVVIVSWKKREMEREKQARLYLPMYNTFNPYNTAEDHEIAGCSGGSRIVTPRAAANPVYFDDHAIQVYPLDSSVEDDDTRLLFEDGAPSFLKPREAQEHTMDFDNEISSDDPEATAAANSIAAAVAGGSSRRSSQKSRSSRSGSRRTPSGSGPPSYTSNGKITQNGTSTSPSSKIHEVSTIPYRHSETPKEPLRPPPLFDPRPTPTSDPRSPFESGSYDNYGADLGDGFSRTSGSPISGARTDSSLSTQKLESLEGLERDHDAPLMNSYLSQFMPSSKNAPADSSVPQNAAWAPSNEKLAHVALEDDAGIKLLVHSKTHNITPDNRNTRKASHKKHKRSQQHPRRPSLGDGRKYSTSSEEASNKSSADSGSGARPKRSSSQSRKSKLRPSKADENFSPAGGDDKKWRRNSDDINNDPDLLKPIYQYTQAPWNEADIMNTVL